jgi:O-methyltransferase domain/Dimerisation domain
MEAAARDRAFQLVSGFRATQMVRAAVELKIPDLVAAGPRSSDDLAASSGVQPGPLRRILRALVSLGVFVESEDGQFGATPISECFRDRPGTQRLMALMLPSESYEAFGDLMHTLRTGEPAFDHVFGMTHWEQLAQEPERSSIFNAAMQSITERIKDGVVAAYDFGSLQSVVDVGGGRGSVIAALLKANPHLRGTVLDLPAGLAETEDYLKEQGVHERCQVVSGNFFESVPAGCDAYVLKHIVHDWNDEKATAILATCRKAMGAGARLILVERIVPARAEESAAARAVFLGDIQMLVTLGGRERTVEEFKALLQGAGLKLTRVIPTGSDFHLIEGAPA